MLGRSGLVFINPRASFGDNDEEEYNIGLGYRHLMPNRNFIVGANLYYDYRETQFGSQFNQLGLGAEFLSDWIDARFNYYFPENDREVVNEYVVEDVSTRVHGTQWWSDIEASGNTLQQTLALPQTVVTTTRRHYIQYETALEGFDMEVGVKLPIPCNEVRVFGGYYNFNGILGADDVTGFKGRLEIRAVPAVYLDAEVYENGDLTGADYFLGARLRLPFDVGNIARGRSPFEGALASFRRQKSPEPFANRLTEMVMRDLHVRTSVSDAIEDVMKREVREKAKGARYVSVTLTNNVTFVDMDTTSDKQDGTAEFPYAQITTGVERATGEIVFVHDGATNYEENVVLAEGMTLWGSGVLLEGYGGKVYGSGIRPTIDGMGKGPAISLADNNKVVGIRAINSGGPIAIVPDMYAGIYGADVSRVELYDNVFDQALVGAYIRTDSDTFSGVFRGNSFDNNMDYGFYLTSDGDVDAVIDIKESFSAVLTDNSFSGNGDGGMEVVAVGYDDISIEMERNAVNGNHMMRRLDAAPRGKSGGAASVEAYGRNIDIRISEFEAIDNGCGALGIVAVSVDDMFRKGVAETGALQVELDTLDLSGNRDSGLFLVTEKETAGDATISMSNIRANDNDSCGLDILVQVMSDLTFTMDSVEAMRNEGCGVDIWQLRSLGDANIAIDEVRANDNDYCGIGIQFMSEEGDAFASFSGIDASRNGEGGLVVEGIAAGDTEVAFSDVSANENQGSGISLQPMNVRVALKLSDDGEYPGQYLAMFEEVEANMNSESGIEVTGHYVDDANIGLFGVAASGNGDRGVEVVATGEKRLFAVVGEAQLNDNTRQGAFLDLVSEGQVGAGFVQLEATGNGLAGVRADVIGDMAAGIVLDVVANDNDSRGVVMHMNAVNDIRMMMEDIEAHDNAQGVSVTAGSEAGAIQCQLRDISAGGQEVGLRFVAEANGEVMAQLSGIESHGNEAQGIFCSGISSNGSVSIAIEDSWLSGNNTGVRVNAEAASSAQVDVANVISELNIAQGLSVAGSAGGEMGVHVTGCDLSDNNVGLRIDYTADSSAICGTGNTIINSTNHGVNISGTASSHVIDFGGGALEGTGGNIIYGSGLRDFRNVTGVQAEAQYNWWGETTPQAGKFQNANYANWLTEAP